MNYIGRLAIVSFLMICVGCDGQDVGRDAGLDVGIDMCASQQEGVHCKTSRGEPGLCALDEQCKLNCDPGYCVDEGCFSINFGDCLDVGESCGCGRGCYWVGDGPLCLPTGDKAAGEACEASSDCALPGQCLIYQDEMMCFTVCNDDRPCTAGTCIDTELGFKVCVPTPPADGGMDGG